MANLKRVMTPERIKNVQITYFDKNHEIFTTPVSKASFSKGGKILKKGTFFVEKALQQKQILVVILQFETLVDGSQDRPVSQKSFILLICYFGSINFLANVNSF